MDDKDKVFFDPSIPLILEKEINNPLVLNKEIDHPLVLNKEIDLSPNLKNSKNNEILKIKDLVKLKYLSSEKVEKKLIRDDLVKDFASIKDSAKKISSDIREKTILINDSINNQKKKK